MRQIELENKKLFKILVDRASTFKQIDELNTKIIDLDKARKKLGYKMERLKDKTTVELKNHTIKLKEFEEVGSVGIEQGKIMVSIFNHVEEYKKMLRKKKDDKCDNTKQKGEKD